MLVWCMEERRRLSPTLHYTIEDKKAYLELTTIYSDATIKVNLQNKCFYKTMSHIFMIIFFSKELEMCR